MVCKGTHWEISLHTPPVSSPYHPHSLPMCNFSCLSFSLACLCKYKKNIYIYIIIISHSHTQKGTFYSHHFVPCFLHLTIYMLKILLFSATQYSFCEHTQVPHWCTTELFPIFGYYQ